MAASVVGRNFQGAGGLSANLAYRLAGATLSEGVPTPSRVDVISQDMHLEIKRFNVALATRTEPRAEAKRRSPEEKNLDFIGNIKHWGSSNKIVGLFGPDILFADMVLMSQLTKLKQDLPKSLLRRFVNGPSFAEIAYYYYRYHLARSRHSADTRTQSPRTKRRRIYPFVLEEYPNDSTGSLLKLTLDHKLIELPEDQRVHRAGRPNVTLVFDLLSALSAWAWQTTHTLVPDESILKILLQTQATESEFSSLRSKLAKKGMQIYTPDADMVKSRAWIPLGGDLSWEPIDDLEHSDEEEVGDGTVAFQMASDQPDLHPISNSLLGSRTDLAITYNAQGEPTKVQHSAGLRPDSPSIVQTYPNSHTLSMKVQRLRSGSSPKLKDGMELPVRPRASSRLIGHPQQPGGTTNPPLHPIRDAEVNEPEDLDQFWPPGNDGMRSQGDGSLDPDNDWGALADQHGRSNQGGGEPTHCLGKCTIM